MCNKYKMTMVVLLLLLLYLEMLFNDMICTVNQLIVENCTLKLVMLLAIATDL